MIDQEAFEILRQLPKLPFGKLLTPDPVSELSAEPPVFTYSLAQNFNLQTYRQSLISATSAITQLTLSEDIKKLYLEKLDELELRAKVIEAVQKNDDKKVTEAANNLFQFEKFAAQDQLTVLAQEFEEHLARAQRQEVHRHKEKIDAKKFLLMARERLQTYGITNWRVRRSRRPLVQTGHGKLTQSPILRIPNTLRISRVRAKRLLAHEIDVHILRAHNGEQSQLLLLGRGLAGYTNFEEGLALYLQHAEDKVDRKLRPGFWPSWTIALLKEHGWSKTYTTLSEARLALYQATGETEAEQKTKAAVESLLLRATRGITEPAEPGVFFARDHIYRSGYDEVKDFVEKNGLAAIDELFVGKISLEHLPIVKKLGLKPNQLPFVLR